MTSSHAQRPYVIVLYKIIHYCIRHQYTWFFQAIFDAEQLQTDRSREILDKLANLTTVKMNALDNLFKSLTLEKVVHFYDFEEERDESLKVSYS